MIKQAEKSENQIRTLIVSEISNQNNDNYRALFDHICNEAAKRFNMYDSNGNVRNATIIEVFARTPCIACIAKRFSEQSMASNVDALYSECHRLAVNILVEELYYFLNQIGYKVLITTEATLEYGKADILITVTNYGLNLKGCKKELIIEVKTGNSISLTQIFRYLLDSQSDTVIVWRIRKRQVLTFNANKIKPLLAEFIRMICMRANRLLSSQQIQPCQHAKSSKHHLTQAEFEKAFEDFSEAVVETLPVVLQTILKQLENITP